MSKIQNDQFYTKQDVSEKCFLIIKEKFPSLLRGSKILEPSAGTGSFINAFLKNKVKKDRIIAYDIEPKHPMVQEKDFLTATFENEKMIAIGNPPFGTRSKLAIAFLNHCAEYCHTVAFIVPVQFQKYGVQSKINKNMKLIYDELLDPTSFENNGKDLTVRCCFQIWTKKEGFEDLRIKKAPDTSHPDFVMYLYNNVPEALKYFDYDWDFAIPRQGFYDYSLRITDKKLLNPKVQYMFFKTDNPEILERLKNIDFEKLSLKNTTIKGYGKADIVAEYKRLYKC